MNIESIREYCLKKKGVSEEFPFDSDTLVFKVMGKMFLLTSLSHKPLRFNVKANPDQSIIWREEYDGDVYPGFHMNKNLWNSVEAEGKVPNKVMFAMIDHSYNEVVKGLPKKLKTELESL